MDLLKRNTPCSHPVKVVQFGEGNFMRAFIDWMIDEMNKKADFNGSVRIIQLLEKGMCDAINEQDGLYTLVLRGVENGSTVERAQIIESVRDCVNAVDNWSEAVNIFLTPTLRFSFSNTTESGIEYREESYTPGKTQGTFPAKVTSLLYERFKASLPGLVFLPCELIDKNGATLKKHILHYAADWKLDGAFINYIENECIFCNTLVDRIVSGYPRAEADDLCRRFGYRDNLIDCGEIFHFFVIEGSESVGNELPFAKANLDVIIVDNQTPYRTRKVRFLNGSHTSSVLGAYLAGFDYVDEMVSDGLFGKYLARILFDEIFVTVPLPSDQKKAFASAVLERFANPFAFHRLLSISLNSVSKWKVRVLPSLLDYVKSENKLPSCLAFSLGALIAFYENKGGKGINRVNSYEVSDDAAIVSFFEKLWLDNAENYDAIAEQVLSKVEFWDMNLTKVTGLKDAVSHALSVIKSEGVRAAIREIV